MADEYYISYYRFIVVVISIKVVHLAFPKRGRQAKSHKLPTRGCGSMAVWTKREAGAFRSVPIRTEAVLAEPAAIPPRLVRRELALGCVPEQEEEK